VHNKKSFSIFPSAAGMSLTKLSLGRNNLYLTSLFPPRESLVSDGYIEKLFYRVGGWSPIPTTAKSLVFCIFLFTTLIKLVVSREDALQGRFFSPELMVAGDIAKHQISLLHKKVMCGEYLMHGYINTENPGDVNARERPKVALYFFNMVNQTI
jgi:hypothetical protein